jgi:hypothetical protein
MHLKARNQKIWGVVEESFIVLEGSHPKRGELAIE